jgi:hypothetical protein
VQSTHNGNGVSLTNGTVKSEVQEESEELKALLKRIPYKTSSIFFRNVPSTMKIEEIENVSLDKINFID